MKLKFSHPLINIVNRLPLIFFVIFVSWNNIHHYFISQSTMKAFIIFQNIHHFCFFVTFFHFCFDKMTDRSLFIFIKWSGSNIVKMEMKFPFKDVLNAKHQHKNVSSPLNRLTILSYWNTYVSFVWYF